MYKHRIDKNSMKCLFTCLPFSPGIHTLKFSNNGFTQQQFSLLIDYLSAESKSSDSNSVLACPTQHLFFDWNPLYKNNYELGKGDRNELFERENSDDLSPYAKL